MSASTDARSHRLRAVLIGIGGAIAGGVLGVALGAIGVWVVRSIDSDYSSTWTDLGVAALTVVVVAPLLTVIGALVAVRLATGRAIARPVSMTVVSVLILGASGALLGEGVTRFSLALVGASLGLAAANAFDRGPVPR